MTTQQSSRATINSTWLLLERVVRTAVAFPASIIVARYLGPSDFGRLSFALSLAYLFQAISSLGLNGVVVRELGTRGHDRSQILASAFFSRLAWGGLLTVSLVAMAVLLQGGVTVEVALTAIVGSSLITQSFAVADLAFQSDEHMDRSVRARLSGAVLANVLSIAFAVFALSLIWFAAAVAIGSITAAAMFVLAAKRHRASFWRLTRFRPPLVRALLKESWVLIPAGLGAAIYMRMDQVMLRYLAGPGELGVYAVAASLSESWLFLPAIMTTAVFPRLVAIGSTSDRANYEARFKDLFALLFLVGVACAILGTVASVWLVPVLYGDAYRRAVPILAVYVWGVVFFSLRSGIGRYLIIERRLPYALWTHIIGAVSNVGLNLLLIPRFGAIGAAWATTVSYLLAGWLAFYFFSGTREVAGWVGSAFRVRPARIRMILREVSRQLLTAVHQWYGARTGTQ